MAGDQALAASYSEAARRYAGDVSAMADAAVLGTAQDHARAAVRASATWQTQVEPARRAWQATVPQDYVAVRDGAD